MISKETIYQTVENFLINTDSYTVDVRITPDNRILVEIDSFNGVSIDACISLNKHIEAQFEEEIGDYELEVSSAGLTEPFKVVKQYEKNIGNEVETLTKDGRKISGILKEVNENSFAIAIEKKIKAEGAKRKTTVEELISLRFDEIKHTKYIIRFK